jgi:hypothetical protein
MPRRLHAKAGAASVAVRTVTCPAEGSCRAAISSAPSRWTTSRSRRRTRTLSTPRMRSRCGTSDAPRAKRRAAGGGRTLRGRGARSRGSVGHQPRRAGVLPASDAKEPAGDESSLSVTVASTKAEAVEDAQSHQRAGSRKRWHGPRPATRRCWPRSRRCAPARSRARHADRAQAPAVTFPVSLSCRSWRHRLARMSIGADRRRRGDRTGARHRHYLDDRCPLAPEGWAGARGAGRLLARRDRA